MAGASWAYIFSLRPPCNFRCFNKSRWPIIGRCAAYETYWLRNEFILRIEGVGPAEINEKCEKLRPMRVINRVTFNPGFYGIAARGRPNAFQNKSNSGGGGDSLFNSRR